MRKEKSFKNFITSLIPYIILLLLGFVRVNTFIVNLGVDIYALNQVFYQIFIYLSLAEAGAGVYINQMYYKHFAKNDKKEITNIFNGAKCLLKKISLIVFSLGIVISFLLKIFTNNNLNLIYMQFVFMLFLFKNIIEYLMVSPKSVIEADQKQYKINTRFYSFKILESLADIILLYCGFNYVIILLGEIVIRFLTYYITNKKIYKEYPWLNNKPTEKIKIKGINNMLWHRVSEAIHYNTDIIITSSFLSPLYVTIYASYNYITKYLTDGVDMVGSSVSSSFGNVIYKENKNNMLNIFEELNMMFLFLASFLATMSYILCNSFVTFWLGSKYIINDWALVFLMINFFIVVSRKPLNIYRNSNGLFKETKFIVMLEAIVNLVLSLILVRYYGLSGILFSTMISMVSTTLWYIPYFIYNKHLNISCLKYIMRLVLYFLLNISISFIGYKVISSLVIKNLFTWTIWASLFGITLLIVYFVVYYASSKYFKSLVKKILLMIKK